MAPQTTGMIDILGPQISFMTEFSGNPQGYCAIKAIVPPGVMVPLHSHPERETFIILRGELHAFNGKEWRQLSDGDVFDVPGNTKHAFRNNSQSSVDLIVVTYESMGRFFESVGREVSSVDPGPPSGERIEEFVAACIRSGYWLGTPEENAEIGLTLL